MIEITRLCKTGGALTKRISLTAAGALHIDGSACVMSDGTGQRAVFNDLHDFAKFIGSLDPQQAIALGALRSDLPDEVQITTKKCLEGMNGSAAALNVIARTTDFIIYRSDQRALALIDIDTKGMPPNVAQRIRKLGGYWSALTTVVPELAQTARVFRRSTSTGISRTDTGAPLAGSNGHHLYILVQDGADAERWLRTLHDKCWLHGLGWMMAGAGGQLLDRSIVDRMVGSPERLVFEGAPVLDPPLAQDAASRQATAHEGTALDTLAACPPLRIVDQARLAKLQAEEAHRLAPDRAKARHEFIGDQTARIAKRTGCALAAARRTAERQCDGVLLPDVFLPFDAAEFTDCTVGDVLADPDRFVGATLADPLEGPDYGRCKAKVMRRADGTPWVNSFAHGRTIYELKHGAESIEVLLAKVPDAELVSRFAALVIGGDVDDYERERLRDIVSERSGTGKRTIDRTIAAERDKQARHETHEEAQRRAAERRDPRLQIAAPAPDAPWLPQMEVLNDLLGGSTAPEPPTRNIDAECSRIKLRAVPLLHLLFTDANNLDREELMETSYLPAPEQLCLVRMDEIECAEMIERHVDYVDKTGRSVHLPKQFVLHFMKRDDGALPTVVAISQLPIVLADGAVLAMRGLDRARGIIFRIPEALRKVIPKREDCTPTAVADAMHFLCDEWLCDVSTDYTGKCVLIADALTLIERNLLPDRPVFFITAGRRGGGKTTTLHMLVMAVFGMRAAAAAWSPNEEERRKAILAYFMEALPFLIWDNIPRGAQISCPHIERSCTTALYTDRKLGVSEMVATAASTVHHFTGNNIGPKGDLASRALSVRLEVDRADPENRPFKHNDPIGWTEAHRGRIMAALYTVLLGNPFLSTPMGTEARTRFKVWWRLIGSAVEHAAMQHSTMSATGDCPPTAAIDFMDLFLVQEDEDEESASLADALAGMAGKWAGDAEFQAIDVAKLVNDRSEYVTDADTQLSATLREFLFANVPPGYVATAKAVTKRLGRHVGEPVRKGDQTLILRKHIDQHTKVLMFRVESR